MKLPIIIALIVLVAFRRIKRSIGFQKFSEPSLIIRMVVFGLVALLILFGAIINPMSLISDGIGIIAGLVLAYIATNHAKFEKRENGLYFKTHIWVEMIVITLFMARLVYRLYMYQDLFQPDQNSQDMQNSMKSMQDPFTGAVIFTFCTYYIGYFSFVLKEAKKALKGAIIQNTPKTDR